MPTHAGDVIFARDTLGTILRDLRSQLGISLREMEKRSGVTDSEIHKIETAQQECRLESLVSICAALGVPPGRVLDDAFTANTGLFNQCISADAGFPRLLEEYKMTDSAERRDVPMILAQFCAVAAYLIRCAAPIRAARFLDFPSDSINAHFLRFSEHLDRMGDGLERLSILESLMTTPISTLRNLGLFPDEYLRRYFEFREMPSQERAGRTLLWTPMTHPAGIERTIRRNEARHDVAASNAGDSKLMVDILSSTNSVLSVSANSPTWKHLLDRVDRLTAGAGAKARLARELSTSRQQVHKWLSGAGAPSADLTLRLQAWATEEEQKTKRAASGETPAAQAALPGQANEQATKKGRRKAGHKVGKKATR